MGKMSKVSRINRIPEQSIIDSDFNFYQYCDSFKVVIFQRESLDQILTEIFQTPKWADSLMKVRNTLARIVGLDAGGNKRNTNTSDYYPIGTRAVYFTVINRNDCEILMAENDKHLDFRISVLRVQHGPDSIIFLTTLVKFNNLLGRIYFFLVKPFHRIIISSLLRRLAK